MMAKSGEQAEQCILITLYNRMKRDLYCGYDFKQRVNTAVTAVSC